MKTNYPYRAKALPADKAGLKNSGEYEGRMETGKSKPSTKAKKLRTNSSEMRQDLFGGKRPGG